ncbi:MAG: VCBS repeat-containing protein [Myxococcales bacterium]|nr:VCBS repeat-containing protein [Myxococcales bacterium]
MGLPGGFDPVVRTPDAAVADDALLDAPPVVDLAPLPDATPVDPGRCGDGVPQPGEFCPDEGQALPGRLQAVRVALGDLDGDGQLDAAAAAFDGFVQLWRNTGNRLADQALLAPEAVGPSDVVLGDVNGDGATDVVVAALTGRAIQVFEQVEGAFVPAGAVALSGRPFALAGGDLNGDGRLDAITANFDRGGIDVLLAGPDGRLAFHAFVASGIEPHGAALADVDGDGRLDALVANAGTHDPRQAGVTIHLCATPCRFAAAPAVAVGNGPFFVDAADLTGDGLPDLVVAEYGTPGAGGYVGGDVVRVVPNRGGRAFGQGRAWPCGNGPTHLALADLDGDGDVDVVTADRGDFDFARRQTEGGATLTVLLNDGRGGLGERVTLALPAAPTGVAVGDIDGDGVPDLAAAVFDARRVVVFRQRP